MTFPELCARKVPSGHNQDLGNQPMNQQVGALYEAQGERIHNSWKPTSYAEEQSRKNNKICVKSIISKKGSVG